MVHISIVPETLAHIGSIAITNTLITAWVVTLSLVLFAFLFKRNFKNVPGKIQNIVELIIETLADFFETIAGDRKAAEHFFPLVATIFIFVLLSNWLGILPGFGSIGFYEIKDGVREFVPFFRSVNSDINMTLALALIAVSLSHFFGVATLGMKKHLHKFLNFKSPISFFTGILEIISELAKIVSFTFRLFGNVFAGEVLLVIIAFLIPYVVPVPFLGLELFVGFIQAVIFAVLALVAFAGNTKAHEY